MPGRKPRTQKYPKHLCNFPATTYKSSNNPEYPKCDRDQSGSSLKEKSESDRI